MTIKQALICGFNINKSGKAAIVNSEEISTAIPKSQWQWLHFDRSYQEVFEWLSNEGGLPEIAINALLAEETRPRIQQFENGYAINLRGVNLNPEATPDDMVSVRLWIEKNRIISVRRLKLLAVNAIREEYETATGPTSIGEFIGQLILGLAMRISSVVIDLDDALDELESSLDEIPNSKDREQLSTLRRQAISLKRFLSPQREALVQLVNLKADWLKPESALLIREAQDQTSRFIEALDAIRERAGLLHEEFTSQMAERNNRNTYVLTVIAAIFLPLGFLTGLLGINVGGVPGTENPLAFLWVTLGIILIGFLEYLLLKWMQWI